MAAVGQLIGYTIGSIDIVSIFGTTFGDTQFKQMTVIAGLSVIFSVAVTSYSVRERVLVSARSVAYVSSFSYVPAKLNHLGVPVASQVPSRSCRNFSGRLSICLLGSRPSAGLNSGHGSV